MHDAPDQSIKRAPVVYGRRPNRSSALPIDEEQQLSNTVRHALTAPSQCCPSSPSPSVDASDAEPSRSPSGTSSFQFGFRRELEKLDEEFEHDAQPCMPGMFPPREAIQAASSQVKDVQNVSMGTPTLLHQARSFSGNISPGSLPPSPTSCHATSSQERPPESPPVHRRARGVSNPVSSDSRVEVQSKSSSISPVRHAITTPHSRSSPTPPTSGEISMLGRHIKGKAPARDVLPLVFDEPLVTELPAKSKRGRRSEPSVRPKTKAPTKKERREAAFESSRIGANRPVEITRTQGHKHSLATFFAGLRRDNIATPTSGTELPSDPIEKFSSPIDRSTQTLLSNNTIGPPTGFLPTSTHAGNQPLSGKVLPPAAGDSDDEMLSVTSMIRANGKRQRLQTMKQVALQHAHTSEILDVQSENDDLLIVEDDMHTVADEEAAQRTLDKAHGSPVKDLATLRRIKHPSVRPAPVSPQKLSRRELQEYAKPSFVRKGNSSRGQLTKQQLDQLMITQHVEEQLKAIKRQEEEWIKGGGRLSRGNDGEGPETTLSQRVGAYAELGLKAAESGGVVEANVSDDESDQDYTPDLLGPSSPEPTDADEGHNDPDSTMESLQVPQSQEEEEEECLVPLRHHRPGQRHPRVVVGSDDEEGQSDHRDLPSLQRGSVSSIEPQTEDEHDKENSAKLMYDRSEDKENKAVVRYELSSLGTTFGSGLGSLHITEGSSRRNLSVASPSDLNDILSSPKGDIRSPLKDISKDEDDLFSSSPAANSPFTESLLRSAALSPPRPSTSTLSLGSPPVLRSERIRRVSRFSLDSESDENDPCGLEPSFLERLHRQVSPEPSLVPINPLPSGGFSQLFSAEDQSLTKPVYRTAKDGLSLTLDVGLKPALEVSETQKQKAETIFEKEQEYVVTAAVQNDRPKQVFYVNDHGFLTQTRPEDSNPPVYRMTPSQASKFIGTQVQPTPAQLLSARAPLRTLSFTISQELSPELPLRRLRKRSPSPLEQKTCGINTNLVTKSNVFDILGKVPKPPSKAQKEKFEKSEFVAMEAEESDEDDMFGFGGPKKDGDEEEENDDQDKVVEGLVDDTAMDAKTEAADLVVEKHREHVEEDDQRLQKLHQDAIEGKFRIKRRGRGIDLDDEGDDDDDDEARRIRQRIHKKRKIEGDSLEALGQNKETRAFYDTYHQDLIDEDDELRHLCEDIAMPVDDDDTQTAEPEKQETVSVDEVRQRVREIVQNNLEVEVMDPEDTSWIDRFAMNEVDDAVRVKVVNSRRGNQLAGHPNVGQMDFDTDRPKRHEEDERERNQLTSWAKHQNGRYQGTGRSGNSTAVTGHTKVKSGGGSLRSTQPPNAATVGEARKTKKTSSLLSTVSNRTGKFAAA